MTGDFYKRICIQTKMKTVLHIYVRDFKQISCVVKLLLGGMLNIRKTMHLNIFYHTNIVNA